MGSWHTPGGSFLSQCGSESGSRKLWGNDEVSGGIQGLFCAFSVHQGGESNRAELGPEPGVGTWPAGADSLCHQGVSKILKETRQYFTESKTPLIRRWTVIFRMTKEVTSLLIKLGRDIDCKMHSNFRDVKINISGLMKYGTAVHRKWGRQEVKCPPGHKRRKTRGLGFCRSHREFVLIFPIFLKEK